MPDVCGSSFEEAMRLLEQMEQETTPESDDRRQTNDARADVGERLTRRKDDQDRAATNRLEVPDRPT
jgi:hypothetical protein